MVIKCLETEVQLLKGALPTVLYHLGQQAITGFISAPSLTVDNAHFDELTLHKVNGHSLDCITREFLLDGVDQNVQESWRANYMEVDVFTTRGSPIAGTISGVLASEYMRQSVRDQQVVGHHKYKTLVAKEIIHTLGNNNSIEINGIDTDTIVTKGASVTFQDKKTCTSLKINGDLFVEKVNNVDARQLASQVVYTDNISRQTLVGNYDIGLLVRGNMDVSSINGINIVELDRSVVKKYGNYRLSGGLVYKDDVVVTGSVQTDTINDELWSNLVDYNSPDKITNTYHFHEVVVAGFLDSNRINKLDLSQEVVLVNTVQRIDGRIKFRKSVSVGSAEGVVMEEGGTVNGIDPSNLHVTLAEVEEIIIAEEINFTSPLHRPSGGRDIEWLSIE
ncbi:uncharacterized protein [Panulirus ornatus]|uniref:uncharacterized protein isoform X3 n=1 Tax=Panulirus ornatus TaxID=150431 RepID=UPI003A861C66